MLKTLAFAGILGVPLMSAADSPDIGTILSTYGIAAPFAALCWWQMQRSQRQLDEARKEISALQDAAISRERELIGRVAPMFYDGARLYDRGNATLAQGQATAADVEEIARQVQALVRRLEERR